MRQILIFVLTLALAGALHGFPAPFTSQEAYNSSAIFKESWDPNAVKAGTGAFVWVDEGDGVKYRRSRSEDSDVIPGDVLPANRVKVTSDNRRFKFPNPGVAPLAVVPGETPAQFLTRLDAAAPDAIINLHPKGLTVRILMQDVLYQSWEYMTHALNQGENDGNRKNFLRKVWEYRQWHHDYILKLTQEELGASQVPNLYDTGRGRLSDWSAAGSTTLTSDIDVNLKGTDTETAARRFNELFLANGWLYEAGIVYDVNVYALDFLYQEATFGGGLVDEATVGGIKTTRDLHGNILKRKEVATDQTLENNTAGATGLAGKEGARRGLVQGGFNPDLSDPLFLETDTANQEIWPHVKARLYMTATEFDDYAEDISIHTEVWSGSGETGDQIVKNVVLTRYNAFITELTDKMHELSPFTAAKPALPAGGTGIQQLNAYAKILQGQGAQQTDLEAAQAADLLMRSSNRVYEAKLVTISADRFQLKTLITEYDGLADGAPDEMAKNMAIENQLVIIRNRVSEATLFANEAYVTDAAVNHAVVGVQSDVAIIITNNESENAVIENMADALKEIARHGGTPANPELGEAAFKSGKYLFRLADAAINMGYMDLAVVKLYRAGDEISNQIKKTVADPADQYSQSAQQITRYFPGVNSPATLNAKVREIAIAAILAKQSEEGDNASFGNEPSAAVGGAGSIVSQLLFQTEDLRESTVGNPYMFQGRRLDPETGFYYFRNRYYDPETAAFLSVDPLGLWHHGQGNGASAFNEDPWNVGDPFGLCPHGGGCNCGSSSFETAKNTFLFAGAAVGVAGLSAVVTKNPTIARTMVRSAGSAGTLWRGAAYGAQVARVAASNPAAAAARGLGYTAAGLAVAGSTLDVAGAYVDDRDVRPAMFRAAGNLVAPYGGTAATAAAAAFGLVGDVMEASAAPEHSDSATAQIVVADIYGGGLSVVAAASEDLSRLVPQRYAAVKTAAKATNDTLSFVAAWIGIGDKGYSLGSGLTAGGDSGAGPSEVTVPMEERQTP